MLCFVCMRVSENTFSIFGAEGIQYKICEKIEKHLSVKPTMDNVTSQICNQCWTKLKDFDDYYEYVAEVHTKQVEHVTTNFDVMVEDKCEDDLNGLVDIKEENFEESYDNDIEMDFLETDEILTENPLLDLVTENAIRDELKLNVTTKSKPLKRTKTKKRQKRKKIASKEDNIEEEGETKSTTDSLTGDIKTEGNGLISGENKSKRFPQNKGTGRSKTYPLDEEKETLKSLLEEITNAENEKTSTTDKMKIRHCSPKQPKRRKGHLLLEENEDLIKKHIKMLCEMCTYESEDFQSLIKHFKNHHTDVKPYIKCCERKLDCPSDILQHAHYHEDPEHFKCSECGKRFINKSGLRDHYLQYHEPEENLPFGCDQCPRRFSRKNLLEHHKSKHIPKTERSYFCEICNPTRAFANEYILQLHIKSRHTKASNICHVCAKEIRDKQAFEKHVRLHFETSGPRLKCPREGCDSWLKDEDNLKQHLRRFHDAQQYECPQCGRICKNKHSLSCHLKNTHTTKTYSCEECQKSFKSQQSLKEHMAGHSGEALYNCPFCTRTFNSKANMYSHKKKAHPMQWELWNQSKMGSTA